jgi:Suppressor of fused protein (SUFU)
VRVAPVSTIRQGRCFGSTLIILILSSDFKSRDMRILDRLKNAFEKPVAPAGDPEQFAALRANAYRELFGGDPLRLLPHDLFDKPPFGGRIDVYVYELPYEREDGQVQVAITSGMSDYRMTSEADGSPCRREIIQYFRECKGVDVARLHDLAWLPLAAKFCLDFFETAGPHPAYEDTWPHSLLLQPMVRDHAEFQLDLGGDAMQLLWHVPLSQAELEFKLKYGLDPLLERMGERGLPWVFDENTRVALV